MRRVLSRFSRLRGMRAISQYKESPRSRNPIARSEPELTRPISSSGKIHTFAGFPCSWLPLMISSEDTHVRFTASVVRHSFISSLADSRTKMLRHSSSQERFADISMSSKMNKKKNPYTKRFLRVCDNYFLSQFSMNLRGILSIISAYPTILSTKLRIRSALPSIL